MHTPADPSPTIPSLPEEPPNPCSKTPQTTSSAVHFRPKSVPYRSRMSHASHTKQCGMEHFETIFEAPSAPSYDPGGASRPSLRRARRTNTHAATAASAATAAATVSISKFSDTNPSISSRNRKTSTPIAMNLAPLPTSEAITNVFLSRSSTPAAIANSLYGKGSERGKQRRPHAVPLEESLYPQHRLLREEPVQQRPAQPPPQPVPHDGPRHGRHRDQRPQEDRQVRLEQRHTDQQRVGRYRKEDRLAEGCRRQDQDGPRTTGESLQPGRPFVQQLKHPPGRSPRTRTCGPRRLPWRGGSCSARPRPTARARQLSRRRRPARRKPPRPR